MNNSHPRQKPSMKDVAQRAGVALSSVSRVMNDHADVSSDMRDRVMVAVAELSYEPDLLASGLRLGSTKTVGFLITDIANPLFAEIAKGAERTLHDAGYTLLLINSEGDPLRDEQGVRLFGRRRVDALILSVADETSATLTRILQQIDVPLVLLDRDMPAVAGSSAVRADHLPGMRAATEHLLELGHARIALLVGPLTMRPNRTRLDGFRAAHRARKVSVTEKLVQVGQSLSAEFGQTATQRLLRLPPSERPTAIISGGNLVLVGVLRTLRRAGLIVARDVSLVSCDDVPLSELHDPPITVVARDTMAMGRAAAQLVLDQLGQDDQRPSHVDLPTELIVRSSTAPPQPEGETDPPN